MGKRIKLLGIMVGLVLITSSIEAIDNFEEGSIDTWTCESWIWEPGGIGAHKAKETFAGISLNDNPKYVKEGKHSLKMFFNPPILSGRSGPYARVPKAPIPSPSLETDAFTFWVYSQKGTGSFWLALYNNALAGFRTTRLPIDFVGWKKFVITKDKMDKYISPNVEWTQITSCCFYFFGNFTIYLDDIKFESSKTAKEIIEHPGETRDAEDITPE